MASKIPLLLLFLFTCNHSHSLEVIKEAELSDYALGQPTHLLGTIKDDVCNQELLKHLTKICEDQDLDETRAIQLKNLLDKNLDTIFDKAYTPNKQGKRNKGTLSFCVDKDGNIFDLDLKYKSDNADLDKSLIWAMLRTRSLEMPENRCHASLVQSQRLHLHFDRNAISGSPIEAKK